MDVIQVFRNKYFSFLFIIFLFSVISAKSYSSTHPLVRSITRADVGYHSNPSVISSNPSIATAAIIGNTVVPGSYSLSVSYLAQAEQLTSSIYTSKTSPLNINETLTLSDGHSQIIVDVAATDSLQDISTKINSMSSESHLNLLSYVIVMQSDKYMLLIGSTKTGYTNAVNIIESGMDGNKLQFSELTAGANASFTLNGINFTSENNIILIGEWLKINLLGLGNVTLTVNDI